MFIYKIVHFPFIIYFRYYHRWVEGILPFTLWLSALTIVNRNQQDERNLVTIYLPKDSKKVLETIMCYLWCLKFSFQSAIQGRENLTYLMSSFLVNVVTVFNYYWLHWINLNRKAIPTSTPWEVSTETEMRSHLTFSFVETCHFLSLKFYWEGESTDKQPTPS